MRPAGPAQQPRRDHRGRHTGQAAQHLHPEQRTQRREEHAVARYGMPAVPLIVPQGGTTVLEQPHSVFLSGGVRAGEPKRQRQPAQHHSDQPWSAPEHLDDGRCGGENAPDRPMPRPLAHQPDEAGPDGGGPRPGCPRPPEREKNRWEGARHRWSGFTRQRPLCHDSAYRGSVYRSSVYRGFT